MFLPEFTNFTTNSCAWNVFFFMFKSSFFSSIWFTVLVIFRRRDKKWNWKCLNELSTEMAVVATATNECIVILWFYYEMNWYVCVCLCGCEYRWVTFEWNNLMKNAWNETFIMNKAQCTNHIAYNMHCQLTGFAQSSSGKKYNKKKHITRHIGHH